jgi:Inner membrane component of T3SS, cytoplasmic domain
MTQSQSVRTPYLTVLTPGSSQGVRVTLNKEHLVVGRAPTCDLCLDDVHVSRTHAALIQRDGTTLVQDLGSSCGTFVNGARVTSLRVLHPGDVVAFAGIQLQLGGIASLGDDTGPLPALTVEAIVGATRPPTVTYDVGQQRAEAINNVGQNQYNSIVQQRESFFREVAATRTKARWLVWVGLLFFVVGFAVFAAGDLVFIKRIADLMQSNQEPASSEIPSPLGKDIFGIPSGLLGWAIAALGLLMLLLGIVLHIVATSRRRRVDRELPMPAPWQ